MFRMFFAVSLFVVPVAPAHAEEHPCLEGGKSSQLLTGSIAKGGTHRLFRLGNNPEKYYLSGLHSNGSVPLVGDVKLYPVVVVPDRYGPIAVHAFQNDTWLQGKLLRLGKGLALGFNETDACLQAMRNAEVQAQRTGSGIWGMEKLPLRASEIETLKQRLGAFTVVEGRVLSVGDRQRRLYLNFGKKWSQDFTVSVVKRGSGAFKGSRAVNLAQLQGLKGRKVEVRGIMEERQGPLIRLFDEAQIKILD